MFLLLNFCAKISKKKFNFSLLKSSSNWNHFYNKDLSNFQQNNIVINNNNQSHTNIQTKTHSNILSFTLCTQTHKHTNTQTWLFFEIIFKVFVDIVLNVNQSKIHTNTSKFNAQNHKDTKTFKTKMCQIWCQNVFSTFCYSIKYKNLEMSICVNTKNQKCVFPHLFTNSIFKNASTPFFHCV